MINLLPPNASALERAITSATSLELETVQLKYLSDPLRCPAAFLSNLAWQMSVDEWDETRLNEPQKRALIKASISTHKKKGTLGAVRHALAALGVQVIAKEWQQIPLGTPYTFGLNLFANDSFGALPLSAELYRNMRASINENKNERSHGTFSVSAAHAQSIGISTACRSLMICRVGMEPQ